MYSLSVKFTKPILLCNNWQWVVVRIVPSEIHRYIAKCRVEVYERSHLLTVACRGCLSKERSCSEVWFGSRYVCVSCQTAAGWAGCRSCHQLMDEFSSLHCTLLTLLPLRSPCDFTSHRVHRTWLGLMPWPLTLRPLLHLPDGSWRSGWWSMPTTNYYTLIKCVVTL